MFKNLLFFLTIFLSFNYSYSMRQDRCAQLDSGSDTEKNSNGNSITKSSSIIWYYLSKIKSFIPSISIPLAYASDTSDDDSEESNNCSSNDSQLNGEEAESIESGSTAIDINREPENITFREFDPSLFKVEPKISFANLVGDIPDDILLVVNAMKKPEACKKLGLSEGTTMLLYGLPGNGKSSLAEAIAKDLNRDFYYISFSSLIKYSQNVGWGLIKSLFDYISSKCPYAVLFIDKIDDTVSIEAARVIGELKFQLDCNSSNIFCIVSTNCYERIPESLVNKFVHIVEVKHPRYITRRELLKRYLYSKPVNISEDFFDMMVDKTDGLSCRDIIKLVERASLLAIERNEAFINEDHCLVALYQTQGVALPNVYTRVLLFRYYLSNPNTKDIKISKFDKDTLAKFSMETDGFTAKDISLAVDMAYYLAYKNLKTTDKSCIKKSDVYASIYCSQEFKFPGILVRSKLIRYFLKNRKNLISKRLCNVLAYYATDNFTGKEIKQIVNDALCKAKLRGSDVIEKEDMYMGLYKVLQEKCKPFVIKTEIKKIPLLFRSKDESNLAFYEDKLQHVFPLPKGKEFINTIVTGSMSHSESRLDCRTAIQPRKSARKVLINSFLKYVEHDLTKSEVNKIVSATENISWWSINLLLDCARDIAERKTLNYSHIEEAFSTTGIISAELLESLTFEEYVKRSKNKKVKFV